MLNQSFEAGILPQSLRYGLITLACKDVDNAQLLTNWINVKTQALSSLTVSTPIKRARFPGGLSKITSTCFGTSPTMPATTLSRLR